MHSRNSRRSRSTSSGGSPRLPAPQAFRPALGEPPRGLLKRKRPRAARAQPSPPPARTEVRLALCQMNATVGDIGGNAERIRAGLRSAREAEADLVLFPELALTGYPPDDLLLREHFLADAGSALLELAAETHGVVAVVGFPERAEDVYNAAAVLADGAIHAIYRKVHLPNYGVFYEHRYFRAGSAGAVVKLGGHRIGLTVCEDIWK